MWAPNKNVLELGLHVHWFTPSPCMLLVFSDSEIRASFAWCSALTHILLPWAFVSCSRRIVRNPLQVQPRGYPQCICAWLGPLQMASELVSLGEKCWYPKRGHFSGAAWSNSPGLLWGLISTHLCKSSSICLLCNRKASPEMDQFALI